MYKTNSYKTLLLHSGICNINVILLLHFRNYIFTPQPLRAVGVLFSPMVSGLAGGSKKFVWAVSLVLWLNEYCPKLDVWFYVDFWFGTFVKKSFEDALNRHLISDT